MTTTAIGSIAQGCSDLYFSEYIEGSGINKALEIYNPTNTSIDLSMYSVELYSNGSSNATGTLNLSGNLNAGDVYVVCNTSPQIDPAITMQKDTSSTVAGFNGDDAIALLNGTEKIDIIGTIGNDPGASWSVDTGSTKDFTLLRKPSINEGNINWIGDGDTEWIAYNQDDFSSLGSHTATACGNTTTEVVAIPMVDNDTNCIQNPTFNFSESSTGDAQPFTYNWDFGDGNSSSIANPSHTYSSAGVYNVTLTVTDQSFVGISDDSTIVVTVENCLSINDNTIQNNFTVFPNPTKDGLINFSTVQNNSIITVYNIIGENVLKTRLNGTSLDLSNLVKGTYILGVSNVNGSITKKIVIE